jgi:2,4-dienoyl-CoA reductase-like NADH-dependent reductase (Old Yellow Enzyme family)
MSDRTLAGWTRHLTGKPVIAVGSVGLAGVASTAKTAPGQINSDTISFGDSALDTLDRVEAQMEAGEFDMIAVGRAILADPDWANKVRDGRLSERIAFEKDLLSRLH